MWGCTLSPRDDLGIANDRYWTNYRVLDLRTSVGEVRAVARLFPVLRISALINDGPGDLINHGTSVTSCTMGCTMLQSLMQPGHPVLSSAPPLHLRESRFTSHLDDNEDLATIRSAPL